MAYLVYKPATVALGRMSTRELPHYWTPEQVRSEPNTSVHYSKGRLVVFRMEVRSYKPLAGISEVWLSAKGVATGFASHPFSYGEWGFTAMAVNRAVSSHVGRVGLI